MANPRTPQMNGATVSSSGSTSFTFTDLMGAAYIKNRGEGVAYVRFDAAPAAASPGANRVGLAENQSLNLDDIQFTSIHVLMDSSGSGIVEVVALQRPGSNGQGMT